ncbi:MAG: LysE family translocator [Rhizomicrobium sp.]
MLHLHAFLVYCGIYAMFIAVPGPGVVSIVARSLGSGLKSAVPAIAGVLVSHIFFITLSVLGMAVLAQGMGKAFLLVKIAGGAYLVYLGVRYWRAPVEATLIFRPESPRQSFFSQLGISLGNPKAIAFFAALLPAVVDIGQIRLIGYFQLLLVCVLVMPPIMFTYAACAATMREKLADKRARKRINRAASVVMIGAGIGIAAG